jgi:hypothetical protein
MRIAILLGALAAAAMFSPSPSAARDGPWCLRTKFIDCSQPSYEMCRFAGSPESGYCYPNLPGVCAGVWAMAYHAIGAADGTPGGTPGPDLRRSRRVTVSARTKLTKQWGPHHWSDDWEIKTSGRPRASHAADA